MSLSDSRNGGFTEQSPRINFQPLTPEEREKFRHAWKAQFRRQRSEEDDKRLAQRLAAEDDRRRIDRVVEDAWRRRYWDSPPTFEQRLSALLECLEYYDTPVDERTRRTFEDRILTSKVQGMSDEDRTTHLRYATEAFDEFFVPQEGAAGDNITEWMEAYFPGISSVRLPHMESLQRHHPVRHIADTIDQAIAEELVRLARRKSRGGGDEYFVILITDKGRELLRQLVGGLNHNGSNDGAGSGGDTANPILGELESRNSAKASKKTPANPKRKTPKRRRNRTKRAEPTIQMMEALALHNAGSTYRKIGETLGISHETARTWVRIAKRFTSPAQRSVSAKQIPLDKRGQAMAGD